MSPVQEIEALESALRDKDDIIQKQYTEITSLRHRLQLAVDILNKMATPGLETVE